VLLRHCQHKLLYNSTAFLTYCATQNTHHYTPHKQAITSMLPRQNSQNKSMVGKIVTALVSAYMPSWTLSRYWEGRKCQKWENQKSKM